MAKISAPSWTTHGYSCRREREILAELAEEQANWLNEHPESTEMFRCGTSLVSVARDLFIKEVLAVEISRREKQLENLEKPWDEHWQKRETLAVYVEFLKSSLDENIHPIVRSAVALVKVLAFLLATSVPTSASQASCISSARYGLTCSLGLELWEEGRRSDKIFQQWHLSCDSNPGSCNLERKLIAIWPETFGGTQVSTHYHSTRDGTLRLLDSKWNERGLEFDVVYVGGDRMPVRMKFERSLPDSSFLNVETFQARSVVQPITGGSLVSQEWRVPDYSYSLKVEMVIAGKKSVDQKGYDDTVKRLTPRDRITFEQSKARCLDSAFSEKYFSELPGVAKAQARYEARLRDIETKISQAKDVGEKLRLFGQQSALSEEASKEMFSTEVKSQITNRFERCLTEAGMSPDGRRVVTQTLLKYMLTKLTKGT